MGAAGKHLQARCARCSPSSPPPRRPLSSTQELYQWASVAAAARAALATRYRLLPYIYTTLANASATGAPALRPLFFSFPADAATHAISSQFMLGPALMVAPALEPGATSVTAYFPVGQWYSLADNATVAANTTTG